MASLRANGAAELYAAAMSAPSAAQILSALRLIQVCELNARKPRWHRRAAMSGVRRVDVLLKPVKWRQPGQCRICLGCALHWASAIVADILPTWFMLHTGCGRQRAGAGEAADAEGQQQLLPRGTTAHGLHRAWRLGLPSHGVLPALNPLQLSTAASPVLYCWLQEPRHWTASDGNALDAWPPARSVLEPA